MDGGTEVKIPGLIARWKRREPDAKFVTTAMMHVAARLLPGGRTLAHKLSRLQYGGAGLSKTVFVIDEISQVPLSAWALIGDWYSLGARFVLLGDFYQFLLIKDQWADSAVSVHHADILRQLARSLRIAIKLPRRCRGRLRTLFCCTSWSTLLLNVGDMQACTRRPAARGRTRPAEAKPRARERQKDR